MLLSHLRQVLYAEQSESMTAALKFAPYRRDGHHMAVAGIAMCSEMGHCLTHVG